MSKERLEVYYRAIHHCNLYNAFLDADDVHTYLSRYSNLRTITFEDEDELGNSDSDEDEDEPKGCNDYYRHHVDYRNKTATFVSSNSVLPIIHPNTFPASWTIRALGIYVIDHSPGDTGNPLLQWAAPTKSSPFFGVHAGHSLFIQYKLNPEDLRAFDFRAFFRRDGPTPATFDHFGIILSSHFTSTLDLFFAHFPLPTSTLR